VDKPYPIREWVEERGIKYRLGSGYYQLTKTELIQAGKAIAVRHKASGRVYTGANARAMLGLPDAESGYARIQSGIRRVRPIHIGES
jgi:hypothetical protein